YSLRRCIPSCFPPFFCPRSHIGQDISTIVFHDIDLTVLCPFSFYTQRLKRRPEPRTDRNPSTHFEPPILPCLSTCRIDCRRRILNIAAPRRPVVAHLPERRFFLLLLTHFDYQYTAFTILVLLLVPLVFLIPLESLFKTPVVGIRRTVLIEFIRPDQLIPVGCSTLCFASKRPKQQRKRDKKQLFVHNKMYFSVLHR